MAAIWGTWLVVAAVMLAFLLFLGVVITRRPLGILIDSRAKMSLSRLQLVLWTWTLVSAFAAVALARQTMDIVFPPEIWALMGISVGSAAGAVIVKGAKQGQEPDTAKVAAAAVAVEHRGVVQVNSKPAEASLADMFKGEEITDFLYVDISKVQMFFFTIAAWLGYIMSMWSEDFVLSTGSAIEFPPLSPSLVTLIGISHAGYLTIKAAPKTAVK